MRNSAWSTQITFALVIASLAPPLPAKSMELTPTADDAQWMNKGVWTARLRNRQVLPDTVRRLGPKGVFYQPILSPTHYRAAWAWQGSGCPRLAYLDNEE